MPPKQSSANSFRLAEIGASRLVRLLGDWAHGPGALHEDLAGKVRHLIEIGAISPGTRLPSERALGSALNLSRNTVSKALDTIRSDGLLSSRQGDGTYVTYAGPRPQPGWADERLRSFLGGEVPSSRIDLRSAALPGLQMVADEMNLLDSSRLRELVGTHGYVPSGLPELRSAIADYYRALQLPTDLDQILVTSGAQQALRLVAASYVEPGATVLIEEPSFRGAIDVLTSLRARSVGVPSDHNGVDPDLLAAAVVEHHPALILLQSTVHNPTGSVMDRLRRSRTWLIAERHGVPVLDDATLADTIIDGDRRPIPLGAGSDLVLTVGSMSKSFWGGLRVGWVRARADLIERSSPQRGARTWHFGGCPTARRPAAATDRTRQGRTSADTDRVPPDHHGSSGVGTSGLAPPDSVRWRLAVGADPGRERDLVHSAGRTLRRASASRADFLAGRSTR